MSMVCPKSGWSSSGTMVTGRISRPMIPPGMSRRCAPSEKAQAATTTKAGFTNSDGWRPKEPNWIQRWAPLISGPSFTASRHPTTPKSHVIRARRRMPRRLRNETAQMMITVGTRYIA